MTTFNMAPGLHTLHGYFDRDLPPALTVDSGDTVVYSTLDAGWADGPASQPGAHPPLFKGWKPERRGDGHALCGPIAVRGAEPGMTLEVRIGELRPARGGWTFAGGPGRELNKRLGLHERVQELHWSLDPVAGVGRDGYGRSVALRPFMGVLGMPPDEPGRHSTAPPRITGGNIDCKDLVTGSSLFLPIALPGALFSVGDGHAAQGDGEVSGTAIECAMERAELSFQLHPEMRLCTPRANTPRGWTTFGFDEDLDEAVALALDAMLDLMGELLGVDRHSAMALASVAVDVRVTQIVNGVQGAHAVLPHGAVR